MTAPTPVRRKAALAFIFVAVVIDMIALGVIIPVLPRLIEDFVGDVRGAAWINGVFVGVWALMQFVCSPILGSLSDRYGRRPVILISMTGLGLDYVLMALAPNLGWLLVGRLISGVTSSNISTAFAYIADVTPEEKRAGAYGMMGAAFGLGFILGPALAGVEHEHRRQHRMGALGQEVDGGEAGQLRMRAQQHQRSHRVGPFPGERRAAILG